MNEQTESNALAGAPADAVSDTTGEVSRLQLWCGLYGGAIAWTLHLLAAYAIAEFGCVSSFRDARFLGITGVAWGILAVTALTLILGAGSLWISRRSQRLLLAEFGEKEDDPEVFLAHIGWICSVVFFGIILAQAVPVLYYMRSC